MTATVSVPATVFVRVPTAAHIPAPTFSPRLAPPLAPALTHALTPKLTPTPTPVTISVRPPIGLFLSNPQLLKVSVNHRTAQNHTYTAAVDVVI